MTKTFLRPDPLLLKNGVPLRLQVLSDFHVDACSSIMPRLAPDVVVEVTR